MPASEVRVIAEPLMVASQEMDIILYGPGLEVGDKTKGKYSNVVSDKYSSVIGIKNDLKKIYTVEYCEIIEETVLSGSTGEHGVNYARYVTIDGVFYMYDDESKVYFTHPRKYDYDSIKVKNSTDKRIIFTIDSYSADDEGNYSDEAMEIEIKLLYDEAIEAWRLDSPTY